MQLREMSLHPKMEHCKQRFLSSTLTLTWFLISLVTLYEVLEVFFFLKVPDSMLNATVRNGPKSLFNMLNMIGPGVLLYYNR